jgi:hypothetical protein
MTFGPSSPCLNHPSTFGLNSATISSLSEFSALGRAKVYPATRGLLNVGKVTTAEVEGVFAVDIVVLKRRIRGLNMLIWRLGLRQGTVMLDTST